MIAFVSTQGAIGRTQNSQVVIMLTQILNREQAQQLEQDEAVEAVYLEGIGGGFARRLPINAEIICLQD